MGLKPTIRAPKLWNIILSIEEKLTEKHANFKAISVARERYRIFLIHIENP